MTYEKILVYDLQRLPEDRKRLNDTVNPLEYEWRRRSIADRERLLDQLTKDERFLIEQTVINTMKAHEMKKITGLSVRAVWAEKQEIISKLCCLRYGAAYRP